MVEIFGLTLHAYGFVIGWAVFSGIFLVEKRMKQLGVATDKFWTLVYQIVLGGLVGARAWHVVTDFYLYQDAWLEAFKIWHGGLSVLGAVGGGVGVLYWSTRSGKNNKLTNKFGFYLDVSVFGLPIAQAIGRLGNWLNHELYGLPTTLPWGISIPQAYRINGFEHVTTYHPLFAYEAILTLGFGLLVWFILKDWQFFKLGQLHLFIFYLWYYSLIRFGLDFLRLQKNVLPGVGLGVNQLVLLGMIIIGGWWLGKELKEYFLVKDKK